MWSDFIAALKELDFRQLNDMIVGMDMLELLKDPYVIALMVLCSIFFIIRGMEKALVAFLSAPAFLVLFQKTVEGTSALDFEADKVLIFVGGFVVIAAVNIYVFFVRGN